MVEQFTSTKRPFIGIEFGVVADFRNNTFKLERDGGWNAKIGHSG
jgi:hypothetical protein